MDAGAIPQVRRFNRIVVERIGALGDKFLGRARPMGETRTLWEIGPEGVQVRALRARLGLDSGYATRLLQSLERQGLVRVETSGADRRVRVARLTEAGLEERAEIDRLSDDVASGVLAPLSEGQRERLVSAMAEVERLLKASMVQFGVEDPGTAEAQWCIQQYYAELSRRFEGGFDPSLARTADVHELRLPAGLLTIARLRNEPIGCGALKLHPDGIGEIKRLWLSGETRGLGLGRRLLAFIEQHAVDHGMHTVRLDTNRTLHEAIALYRSTGYFEVAPFNDEPYAHHWFEKRLRMAIPPEPA
ncbi:MAG: MarR family winged helix-turn-helix transcriptional regulator [Chloroflexota bacterium]